MSNMAKFTAKFANMPIEEVAEDPQAQRIGKNMFDTYCIQCHGSDAKGSKGFPNLTDGDWLWAARPSRFTKPSPKAALPSWHRGGLHWVKSV